MSISIVLATAIGLGAGAPGTGAAAGDPPAPPPTASLWGTDSSTPITDDDADRLGPIARQVGTGALDTANGHAIDVGFSQRMVVIPTTSDALCYDAQQAGTSMLRICGHGFPTTGVIASYTTGPDTPTSLVGVVARDVTSVRLVTSDARTHDVDVSRGVIWWTAPVGARIRSMVAIRAGLPLVERQLFSSASPG